MQVETTRFGAVEVGDEAVIRVDEGIPGFRQLRRIVLIEADDAEQGFYWIQDLDDPDLAFLAVVPWEYFPEYTFTMGDDDEFALRVDAESDLLVLSLVTVDREANQVTANLLGPFVINESTRLGRQVVVQGGDLPTKAPLGPV